MQKTLCFIGGGSMSSCIISGLLTADFPAQQIWATARSSTTCEKLRQLGNIHVSTNNIYAIQQADVIFLGTKPYDLEKVIQQIKPHINNSPLIVSIAANISIATLNAWLPNMAIVRCMPNTPAKIRQGIHGLIANNLANANHKTTITEILNLTGYSTWLQNESAMQALTVISGCGPAYAFMFMHALITSAQKLGLSEKQAKLLVTQTTLGAAMLAQNSSDTPMELCKSVCSPGGITEKGVQHLTQNNFEQMLQRTIEITYAKLET